MRLLPFATAAHVEEALRLFQVSTLDAAMSGSLSGKIKILDLSGYHFKIALEAESKAHGHIYKSLVHSVHAYLSFIQGIVEALQVRGMLFLCPSFLRLPFAW